MTEPVFLDCRNGGAIGLMPCPGRFRALDDDVALIADSGVGFVLSLIKTEEQPEMVSSLPVLLTRYGIDWSHFPIDDFGVPAENSSTAWIELARDIHNRLDNDGRVLVHCWGGLGRSGMIALRILIERGEPATDAFQRLRTLRPGAIETGAQLAWARG